MGARVAGGMPTVVQSYMRDGLSKGEALREARLWQDRMEKRRLAKLAKARAALADTVPATPTTEPDHG